MLSNAMIYHEIVILTVFRAELGLKSYLKCRQSSVKFYIFPSSELHTNSKIGMTL